MHYLFINYELGFNVKFPLLRLIQFQSDLKSTITHYNLFVNDLKYFLFIFYEKTFLIVSPRHSGHIEEVLKWVRGSKKSCKCGLKNEKYFKEIIVKS